MIIAKQAFILPEMATMSGDSSENSKNVTVEFLGEALEGLLLEQGLEINQGETEQREEVGPKQLSKASTLSDFLGLVPSKKQKSFLEELTFSLEKPDKDTQEVQEIFVNITPLNTNKNKSSNKFAKEAPSVLLVKEKKIPEFKENPQIPPLPPQLILALSFPPIVTPNTVVKEELLLSPSSSLPPPSLSLSLDFSSVKEKIEIPSLGLNPTSTILIENPPPLPLENVMITSFITPVSPEISPLKEDVLFNFKIKAPIAGQKAIAQKSYKVFVENTPKPLVENFKNFAEVESNRPDQEKIESTIKNLIELPILNDKEKQEEKKEETRDPLFKILEQNYGVKNTKQEESLVVKENKNLDQSSFISSMAKEIKQYLPLNQDKLDFLIQDNKIGTVKITLEKNSSSMQEFSLDKENVFLKQEAPLNISMEFEQEKILDSQIRPEIFKLKQSLENQGQRVENIKVSFLSPSMASDSVKIEAFKGEVRPSFSSLTNYSETTTSSPTRSEPLNSIQQQYQQQSQQQQNNKNKIQELWEEYRERYYA